LNLFIQDLSFKNGSWPLQYDKNFINEQINSLIMLVSDELLDNVERTSEHCKETAEMQEADRKRQLKSASTGNARGSSEKPSRKIYRRADIIKLMQTDPDRYQQMAPEIRQAYAEGRVK
jgi:hypothetical protein